MTAPVVYAAAQAEPRLRISHNFDVVILTLLKDFAAKLLFKGPD
jgi:hypothetical protein